MTLNDVFSAGLAGLFDPVAGLGEQITLAGQPMNALVRYEIDLDDAGYRADVLDLDILRKDYDLVPDNRTVAVVDGSSWYYWKQISGDSISRRLRFRKDIRSKFAEGQR